MNRVYYSTLVARESHFVGASARYRELTTRAQVKFASAASFARLPRKMVFTYCLTARAHTLIVPTVPMSRGRGYRRINSLNKQSRERRKRALIDSN